MFELKIKYLLHRKHKWNILTNFANLLLIGWNKQK